MRNARILLVTVAALAAIVLTTGPTHAGPINDSAEAAPTWIYLEDANGADCPAGYVCLWENAGYVGAMWAWHEGYYDPDFTDNQCLNCTGNRFHDDASSWWNRTSRHYCVSDGTYGGNPDNTMPIGTFGNFTGWWNDRASSIGFLGCP